MDQVRITRFITPSTFFLASLFFGAWFADPNWLEVFKVKSPGTAAMIAGATATALFPLGFIITAVFTIFLRVTFFLISKFFKKSITYQISLSEVAWGRVWIALNQTDSVQTTRANRVYAGLTYDHEILHEGVHAAAVRLWSAFNIAGASCTALILALLVGSFKIRWTLAWIGLTGCLLLLFISVAVLTWKDHMGLLEFQSHRIVKTDADPKE